MEDSKFVTLIPAHSPYVPETARAMHPTSSDQIFFHCVNAFRDLVGKVDKYDLQIRTDSLYPYCKLDFVDLLHKKCKDSDWIRRQAKELVPIYFSLICDRGLLFAQTRETTSSTTTVPYTEYLTNLYRTKKPNRASIVESALRKLTETFHKSVSLDETEISKTAFTCMLEFIQTDLCPPKGRPYPIIEYPPGLEEGLSFRTKGEDQYSWEIRRNQKLYESAKTFGISARQYYRKNFGGSRIPEGLWKEMVVKWLPRLKLNIDVEKSRYGQYRPYFLEDQWLLYKQFQEVVQDRTKELQEVLCYTRHEIFDEDRKLFVQCTLSEKLDYFHEDCKIIDPSNGIVASKIAGILFLLRTHTHPLFGGRRIMNIPSLQRQQELGGSIEDGNSYFDKIQDDMTQCLQYTARNLLSIDNMRIKLDDFEQELSNLEPYMQQEMNKVFEENHPSLEPYKQLFFSPVYQKEALRNELQKISDQVNWSKIPLADAVEKYPHQFSLEQRMNAWKISLTEYRLMQCLIEEGYQQLRDIARSLFCVLGDF